MSWLPHVLGLDNPSGAWYAWWSGFFADVSIPATMTAGMLAFWRHRNCHETGCWRLQHHPLDTCRKHKTSKETA